MSLRFSIQGLTRESQDRISMQRGRWVFCRQLLMQSSENLEQVSRLEVRNIQRVHVANPPENISELHIVDAGKIMKTRQVSDQVLPRLLLRDWWRAGGAVIAAPVLGPLWAASATRTTAASGLLWLATVGIQPHVFSDAMSQHVERLVRDVDCLVHRDGIRAVKEHQHAGDCVVVVTGCAADLAAALCSRLELHGVRVIGSTLRRYAGGWVADQHCVGQRKVSMLVDAGMPPPWSFVYTDNASDLPLLRLGERRYLVNPRQSTLRRVRRQLGAGGFETVRWQ